MSAIQVPVLEIEPTRHSALLDELHERDPGAGLGDRADAAQRVGIGRLAGRCESVTLGEQDVVALDDGDANARDVVLVHGRKDGAVGESLDMRGIERQRCRRLCRRALRPCDLGESDRHRRRNARAHECAPKFAVHLPLRSNEEA
jgi:hypothetical protein